MDIKKRRKEVDEVLDNNYPCKFNKEEVCPKEGCLACKRKALASLGVVIQGRLALVDSEGIKQYETYLLIEEENDL